MCVSFAPLCTVVELTRDVSDVFVLLQVLECCHFCHLLPAIQVCLVPLLEDVSELVPAAVAADKVLPGAGVEGVGVTAGLYRERAGNLKYACTGWAKRNAAPATVSQLFDFKWGLYHQFLKF